MIAYLLLSSIPFSDTSNILHIKISSEEMKRLSPSSFPLLFQIDTQRSYFIDLKSPYAFYDSVISNQLILY